VAIKMLPTELADQPGYREQFRSETHAAAQLTESHIIPIFDTFEEDGLLFSGDADHRRHQLGEFG
jgi:hypothetical protein